MALNKTVSVNNSGVNATYWVVTGIDVDLISMTSKVTFSGFLSQEARLAGRFPLMKHTFFWNQDGPINRTNLMAGTALAACYEKAKLAPATPFEPANPLQGATDV